MMEEFWEKAVDEKIRKDKDPRIQRTIKVMNNESQETFMKNHLQYMRNENKGNFTYRKNRPNVIQWRCERSNHSSGSSSGNPEKTRANSCTAYVSFQFITMNNTHGCIIRALLEHNGHNLNNHKEKSVSHIDEDLLQIIYEWLSQGLSNCAILVKSVEWATKNGKTNLLDRGYYVTPQDIRNIRKTFNLEQRMDGNDCISVGKLVKSDLKDSILYYQPLSHAEKQPLMIVYSSPWQLEQCKKFGPTMIFLDATYKGVTQYGFAFYAVLVKNSEGQGIPVSFFILSEESSDILKVCLQKLHEAADCLTPRCVMVDRDMKEIKAIKAVFQNTSVLLCWFHVLQAVHRWLMRQEGGNLRDPSLRNTVIRGMVSLKQCNTEMEFQEHSVKIFSDIERETKSARVSDYLKEHWLNIGVMWSNFGRQVFHHHSETNNVVERFFFGMKYNFLAGYANKRVDDLLLVLSSHVVKYYSHLDALKAAGRLRPKTSDALLGVERMKSRGLDHSVSWQCEGKCNVPSETVPGRMYLVDLVYTTCTCEYANLGNMCKHVLLAKCVSASSDIDVNGLRQTKADILYSRNEYVLDKLTVVVHSNGHIGIVNMKNMQCSCLSNSHGEVCVCLTLAQKLVGNTDLEEVGMCVTDSGPTDSEEPLTKWCIKDMVSDLNSWCNSTDYKTSLEVYSGVKHVHKLVFGRYTAVTRKRKIERLHSYRRRVELAKKHLHDMHNYSFSERGKRQNQTQHSDGKFKRKRSNRKTRVR